MWTHPHSRAKTSRASSTGSPIQPTSPTPSPRSTTTSQVTPTPHPQYGDADPAIGMVGGSYGGGIQLVTAGIDPRVDVIVPGIAWNSLVDSLYPNKTFKTSYASLLLLALVTTGSRINPALYPAFLLGALAGHPHAGPAGIAGLQRSVFPHGEHRRPDAVHPGHRRWAVPAAAVAEQRELRWAPRMTTSR